MGYMHIESLYKCPEFFELFKKVYAMEKIHGTSGWICLANPLNPNRNTDKPGSYLKFHGGSVPSKDFEKLFDVPQLEESFESIIKDNGWTSMKIHGEVYGSKIQGMTTTYGKDMRFIVFDVKINVDSNGDRFLDVPDAKIIADKLLMDFVYFEDGPCDPKWIEEQANSDSVQAVRNSMGPGIPREGVVVRPLHEACLSNGRRAIAKHKNAEFWEIETPRPLGEKLKLVADKDKIVRDWVTPNRVSHVLDHLLPLTEHHKFEWKYMNLYLDMMVEDVKRESEGEIIWANEVEKDIRKRAGMLLKINN
ncbi:RNA ligase 2 [Tupanvirus deep ocean]|uniref:RNA ligase 2 n=2 Tax=Tupanvirus TaxID=2094720 RepID=A0AC62A7E7_9VIRU|nr:RNA ligase 2 [Tupanvirus deep ocean]QKU33707.1 RNA ligase 2 [Tupanvirus deep ocean]